MRNPVLVRAVAITFGAVSLSVPTGALAGVTFFDTNQQGTNVNIAAEAFAPIIQGEVGNTGVALFFSAGGITLHGQHGVAFVEPANPADQVFTMSLIIENGWDFLLMDWKLDAVPPSDGSVTFAAYDSLNNLIPLSSGTNAFPLSHNGQNPFHLHADAGTPVHSLVITSTVPLADIKQVSVDLVPTPGAAGLVAGGVLLLGRRRR